MILVGMTADPVKLSQLAWALAHLFWQATAVAALLALILRFMDPRKPTRRYAVACLALVLIAAAPAVSLLYLTAYDSGPLVIPFDPSLAAQPGWQRRLVRLSAALQPQLKWIVLCWCGGVLLLSLWHIASWFTFRRGLRAHTSELRQEWNWVFDLVDRLKIRRPVSFLECRLFDVPATTGWLRPLVLLPATALAALRADHIKAVIVHELAHIRRHDYVVNLLQSVVEGLLFFHPAVWWVSAKVRQERENCCDELAAEATGDRGGYAAALLAMEELRPDVPLHALGAKGGAGSLVNRVERLLRPRSTQGARHRGPLAALATAAALLCLTLPLLSATLTGGRSRGLGDVRSLGAFIYDVVQGGRPSSGAANQTVLLDALAATIHRDGGTSNDAAATDQLVDQLLGCGSPSALTEQIVPRIAPERPYAYAGGPGWRYGSNSQRFRLIERLWRTARGLRTSAPERASDYARAALLLGAQETYLFGATAVVWLIEEPDFATVAQLDHDQLRRLRRHVADHQTITRVADAYRIMVQDVLEELKVGPASVRRYHDAIDLLRTMAPLAEGRTDVALRLAALTRELELFRQLDPMYFDQAKTTLARLGEPELTRWITVGPSTSDQPTTRRGMRRISPEELQKRLR